MAMMRWEPRRDLDPVSREMERMMNRMERVFGSMWPMARREEREALGMPEWAPDVDISEDESAFHIKADLPEVKKEDVKVSLQDSTLTIRGERRREEEKKGERFHRIERSYGSFMRSFTLPEQVDESKIQARFHDGILEIDVPKTEKAAAKGREIQIK